MITENNRRLIAAIQEANHNGHSQMTMEASSLTGSGTGKGGTLDATDAFSALRLLNPLRRFSRESMTTGSMAQFVARVGNAQLGASNPWGYDVQANAGSPNYDTVFWQQNVQAVSAMLPIRTAVLDDVNGLNESIMLDLVAEMSQIEAGSMQTNDDTAAIAGNATGGQYGLRGLDTYAGKPTAGQSVQSAWGTSGTGATAGRHTIATVGTAAIAYDDIVNLVNALPGQYWGLQGTAFIAAPSIIQTLRKLKDQAGMPVFLDVGQKDGAVGYMFGFPVFPSTYMKTGADSFPIYLANWPRFLHVVDHADVTIQRIDQSQPGFANFFIQKRVCSSVANPFAGARLYQTA